MADGDQGKPPGVVSRKEHARREAEHDARERRQNEARVAELARGAAHGIDLVRESLKIALFFVRKPLPTPARPGQAMEVVGLRDERLPTIGAGAALAERARIAQDNRRMLETLRWTEKTLRGGGKVAEADAVARHMKEHWA